MSALPPLLVVGLLAVGAAVLVGPGPSWVARWTFLHRVPRAAVVLWQAGAVAALISVFGMAWVVTVEAGRNGPHPWWAWVAVVAVLVFAGVVAGRLAWAWVRVIAATGARRRRHRDLVDLLASEESEALVDRPQGLRVLAEARPLAYCLPGLRQSRVVLSAGTLAVLSRQEVAAVLAHERAHLRARHDLVLASFDAVHQAFPHAIRSELPAAQARLLVEMLADDAAARTVGRAPLGRALVALSESVVPEAGLGVGRQSTQLRLERLAGLPGPAGLVVMTYALAAGLVIVPVLALFAAAG
jgi:Zn-dependent protease with chaperone function